MTEHAHHHHDHPQSPDEADDFAELIDLDAEVLHEELARITGWLHEASGDQPVRRILDLGAGSGTGTIALVHRFPDAQIVAIDASADLLERTRSKAAAIGAQARVHVVLADLDEGWPDVDRADAAWASLSLHHLSDPDVVLRHVHDTLLPGGVFAVIEMAAVPRFLPHDLGIGRPGLEERCHDATKREFEHQLPDLGSDWGPRLRGAGFATVEQRAVDFDLQPPHSTPVARYARAFLRRISTAVDGLGADDRATLDVLLGDGPQSLDHRDDLTVRGTRTVWLARRD